MVSYSTLNDFELADLLKIGDDAAFKFIYKNYWDKLLVVAGKRLNDVAEAEEAVQEIFLNLWRRREALKLRVGFDNYFAVAVKFEIINRLAKRVREDHRNQQFTTISVSDTTIPERFDLDVLQKQLEHVINSLPEKCQLIFRMSRENDFTNKKIAQELNISEKAVEKQITKALKILRSHFGRYLPFLLFFI